MKKKFQNLSKGQTLFQLRNKIKNFTVPNLLVIKLSDWKKNRNKVLDSIKDTYIYSNFTPKLAIRSSSQNEDGLVESSAGKYLSLLNINTNNDKEIISAINKVIKSYKLKKNHKNSSEIIIQEMIEKTIISGVIFTYEINKGSPYYVINYDDTSGKTDTVTSGKDNNSNKTLYVFREKVSELKSKRFKLLLLAVKELEKVLSHNYLDIEFSIDQNLNLFLFQVRKITLKNKWKVYNSKLIRNRLDKINILLKKKLGKKKNIYGKSNIFGQMPDWNPAEIIGEYPRPLSYSLYRSLITNKVWLDARSDMGYLKPKSDELMINFCGYPYIDTRLSLNSFLPSKLKKETSEKLINFWIEKLKKNPHLHDKIEFEIAITSFTFDIDKKIKDLIGNTINNSEKKIFKKEIKKITLLNLNENYKTSIKNSLKKIEILKQLQKSYKSTSNLKNIKKIIYDCRNYGTKPFSILARHGFIGISFLKSLVSSKILSNQDVSEFLMNIKTISSEFIIDIKKLNKKNKDIFFEKYGHLRPGTYDILSKKYSDNFDIKKIAFDKKKTKKKFILSKKQKNLLNDFIKKNKVNLNSDKLFSYCEKSIIAREYSKFIFTKSVSNILESIIKFGKENNISREDLSYLQINDIIHYSSNLSKLKKIVKKNKINYNLNNYIKFPQIISKQNEAYISPYQFNKPNFITTDKISGNLKFIQNNLIKSNISNKILLIESADPGYDWIFTHKIKGLITKYGGSNSHMAIRCAEFNLPAAIGCGEKIFNYIKNQKKITLNCLDKKITNNEINF